MKLADKVGGRIISHQISIQLVHNNGEGELAETDDAEEIGNGLILEAMKVLKMAAEAEGFTVIIRGTQFVY